MDLTKCKCIADKYEEYARERSRVATIKFYIQKAQTSPCDLIVHDSNTPLPRTRPLAVRVGTPEHGAVLSGLDALLLHHQTLAAQLSSELEAM